MYILRGCPGSGKSWLAKRLAGRLGAKVYSADDMLMADGNYVWTAGLCAVGHQINQKLVRTAMQRGDAYIVVDNTHLKPKQARPYVNMAKEYGYKIEVREPETPWRHDVDELLARGQHGLPREAVEHMLETWQNVPLAMFKKVLDIP